MSSLHSHDFLFLLFSSLVGSLLCVVTMTVIECLIMLLGAMGLIDYMEIDCSLSLVDKGEQEE